MRLEQPSRKAYGRSERAVHCLRTGREELETAGRQGAQPESLYGGRDTAALLECIARNTRPLGLPRPRSDPDHPSFPSA